MVVPFDAKVVFVRERPCVMSVVRCFPGGRWLVVDVNTAVKKNRYTTGALK